MSTARIPSAPRPRPSQSARAFSAAKAEYLAGAGAEDVCRRHDIRPAYFLRLAGEQGWRRPDPAPAPTPAAQNEPLVIPEAPPGAIRDGTPSGTPAPLTAAQMADKAWAMLQTAMAAGRLIEARGWLRLHKDLQPHVRAEAAADRRARMDRDAAALHAPDPAQDDAVGLQLDGFSPSESNTPDSPTTPSPSGSTGGSRHADGAEPAPQPSASLDSPDRPGNDERAGGVAPPLHCFSRPESNKAGPDP
ncbi:MAG: hypothetical protein V7678_10195 [Brevundimonas sp.]